MKLEQIKQAEEVIKEIVKIIRDNTDYKENNIPVTTKDINTMYSIIADIVLDEE